MSQSTLKHSPLALSEPEPDPEDQERREELCLQLAENLFDLGACDFFRELRAGDARFVIRVKRC